MKAEPGRKYKHKKRGTIYEVVSIGKMQVTGPRDNEKVVVYHKACPWGSKLNLAKVEMWVRPLSEFTDGRFEEV